MAEIRKLPLTHQTMFAELTARCMDTSFDEHFAETGSFVRMAVKGRRYWYYSGYKPKSAAPERQRVKLYVGPVEDPEITRRVAAFRDIKSDYAERRAMVQSLVAAGLPSPAGLVGDIAEGLWKAGLFRLRGVLVGTLAFQTYSGFLGVRTPNAATMTGDADFAQFHSISGEVEDEVMPPILEVLRAVDGSFKPIPHQTHTAATTKFRNRSGFDVEFLTPNRGSDDHQGKPSPMAALGGVSAEPLRYLDYLIHAPVRSVLLHKGGVPVTVPAPERYAVHKLIVAQQRRDDDNGRQKARKDIQQSTLLFQALDLERRLDDLGSAWMEAWDRGPAWREALAASLPRLDQASVDLLARAVSLACVHIRKHPQGYGFDS
jgi:hypothetical protein